MNPMRVLCVVSCLALASSVQAEPSESASSPHVENGIPISQLIAAVQKKTGKKFVIDPRVHGEAELLEKDVANISYDDLLLILQVSGFVAIETGGWVEVLPNATARQVGGPVISGKEKHADAEIVTKVLGAKSIPVAQLVPILRPMIPQYGHLAAIPCSNRMVLVDTYANVRRLEAVIESLDVGEPYKPEKCEVRAAPEH